MLVSSKPVIAPIKLSDSGATFIGGFEGLSLKAYLDGGGLPTIGYGHRIPSINAYPEGITISQAIAFMHEDVKETIQGITALKLDLPFQHHQDAVISLVYNIGIGAFRKSTIFAHLYAKATDLWAWDAWNRDNKGVVEGGLVRRRAAEMKLFIWGVYS
jgi:lysozyme